MGYDLKLQAYISIVLPVRNGRLSGLGKEGAAVTQAF